MSKYIDAVGTISDRHFVICAMPEWTEVLKND